MTQHFDDRARRAGAAVQARADDLDPDLDTVVRRGRRPRPATALGVLLALALVVPGAVWLSGLGGTSVELEAPADAPGEERSAPETEPVEPEPTTLPAEPEDDEPAATDPDDDEPTTAPTPTPTPGPEPAGEFGTEEVSAHDFPFGGGEVALLTDVRVSGHDGFDRVVLELDGADVPSYRVTYVDPPIVQDGSGDELEVDGTAFLELRLTPASGVDSVGTEWEPTYHGPNRLRGDTRVVNEVVRTGDFEANLAWVVGLDTQRPFAVTVLSGPMRLVVDIQSE